MLVIPIFIPHRGCPHRCLFCNQEKIAGEADGACLPDVPATIDRWLARSPGHAEVQVAFYGGSFTCLPEAEQRAMLAAVQPYLDAGRVHGIRLSTRPDCVTSAGCELLKACRVDVIELGVQSMNDRVLAASRRGHDRAQVETAVALLRQAGFTVGVQLMPGLPGETRRSFLAGIEAVIGLRPDFVRLYPVLVVKDSELERLYLEKDYRPLSLHLAVAMTARAYEKLTQAGIGVIRMGLQPSASLAASLVAGPFHPAFGELVQSRLWLKKIRAGLARLGPSQHLALHISHRDRSAVAGMNKHNINRLAQLGFAGRYSIVPDNSMERGSIRYVVS